MGKTGLIHHVFHNMQENNDVKCFYVDLYQTDSLELLVKKLADTIPGFKVDVEPGQAEYSLSEIFAYMEQSDYRCFVAFDETDYTKQAMRQSTRTLSMKSYPTYCWKTRVRFKHSFVLSPPSRREFFMQLLLRVQSRKFKAKPF